MKKKLILKTTLATLAALLLLLVLVVLFWLGPTVRVIAEGMGSKALGTPVSIEYLSINPRNGTIHLSGFQIETHEGFSRTNTWNLAELHVSIDMGSLFSDTIIVREIRIDSPHFTYEQNTDSDNITELIKSIEAFADIDLDAPKETKEPKDDLEKEPKKVMVEQLVINDVQLHIANTDDPELDIQLALEQLSLSLTNGVVQLKHLALSNPGRMETSNLFELESMAIKLDPDSIYAKKIVIEDVQVIKPHAFLEQNPKTDTVAEFMKIAGSFAARMITDPAPTNRVEEIQSPETSTPPPGIELHNLLVDDIQLKLLDTANTNAPAESTMLAGIGSISVRLVEGVVQINAITVPNPSSAFTATNLFHLARIGIILDPETVFSDQVVIKEVFVDSPTVNLERTENTGNIAVLQKIAEGFIPPAPEASTASTPVATEEKPEPLPLAEQPVICETLLVTNLTVNMISPVETNALANVVSFPSLSQLNPLAKLGGVDTNATDEIEAPDGQLTLMAFDLLTIKPLEFLMLLDNLQVGNPEGFANKNIVQLDQFVLDIDPDTLQSDTLLIREILIDNPTIAYERKLTTDNIKAMQDFIEGAVGEPAAKEEEEKPEAEADRTETGEVEEAEGQKVIIGHLLVKSGLVKAKLSLLPSAPIPLPKIEMNDIGKEKGGASPAAAAAEIGQKFYDAIIGSVSGATGFAGDLLKGAGKLVMPSAEKDAADEPAGQSEEAASATEEQPVEEPPPVKKKKRRRRPSRPGRHF